MHGNALGVAIHAPRSLATHGMDWNASRILTTIRNANIEILNKFKFVKFKDSKQNNTAPSLLPGKLCGNGVYCMSKGGKHEEMP